MTTKILIIGATSAIAEQCARMWAKTQADFFLVGRDAAKLDAIAADLLVRGAGQVDVDVADLCLIDAHAGILGRAELALGCIDIALVAHGSLTAQSDQLAHAVHHMLQTNAVSTISIVEHIAHTFERQQTGVLAVISSVAGDRGRASNALYGAAKAAVTAHASATRQRLARCGAWLVTVKPGFVDTPMTAALPKGPLWASAEKVAQGIVSAVQAKRAVVYLPGYWFWIMCVIRVLPERVFLRTRF